MILTTVHQASGGGVSASLPDVGVGHKGVMPDSQKTSLSSARISWRQGFHGGGRSPRTQALPVTHTKRGPARE